MNLCQDQIIKISLEDLVSKGYFKSYLTTSMLEIFVICGGLDMAMVPS